MKVLVFGDGTLAQATRAGCQAAGFETRFLGHADVAWMCEDVPVTEDGYPDYDSTIKQIGGWVESLSPSVPILISSQLPVGSTAQFEAEYPGRTFAYSPENLRVAAAETDFSNQSRIIVGRRDATHDPLWRALIYPFTLCPILTDPETAEMVKHALNTFLALQIAFANEIGEIARQEGADPFVLSHCLRTDDRVAFKAPLTPGQPFGGGHLARDCRLLSSLVDWDTVRFPLITHILQSNRVSR